MIPVGHETITGTEGTDHVAKKVLVNSDQQQNENKTDGPVITADPGSLAAKKAWTAIEQDAKSPEAVAKAKALNPKAVGLYQGKPLVPGAGPNQGDFQFMKDKLVYFNGYSPEVAERIAGKVAGQL